MSGDDHDGHDHGHSHGHDHERPHADHDAAELGVAVLTISSSRTREDDPSGDAVVALVEDAGHEVVVHDLAGDDYDDVQSTVDRYVGRDAVDVVVTTGGTGVAPDDVTVEAVRPLLDKELPGFGELFRHRSYEEVGSRALASRATAGIAERERGDALVGVPVFCLPGSESAVRLGVEEFVLPEASHLVTVASGER